MKIAYLLSWEMGQQDGVTKKVLAQTEQWLKLGHEVQIFCICKSSFSLETKVPVFLVQRRTGANIFVDFRYIKSAYENIYKGLLKYQPDVIYHRSEIYQSGLKKIMKSFPTVVEMNSNDLMELQDLSTRSVKGAVRYHYYKLVRDAYLSSAVGFCCVTHEIAQLESIRKYDKPIAVIPNTVNVDKFAVAASSNSTLPRLLFMGSPNQPWHGVDKIISLAKATVNKLKFEIVGPTKPDYELPENITFHGFLKQPSYEKVLENCDIGVCTMALHRNNMEEACPLKTREYLAYGLPIIVGYKDTVFSEEVPNWVLQLDNTEDNVQKNITRIIDFCYQYKNIRLNRHQVSHFIDISYFENKRTAFLESLREPQIN